ncbi:MAG: carbon-nitrogen hydrolase family protein [Pseudomonadota bacterium]
MKIATAAYPLDVLTSWAQYEDKIAAWVHRADADLLVFPEYAAMELATLAGLDVAGDLEASLHAVSERIPEADAVHQTLARETGKHVLSGSAPVILAPDRRPVNRARLHTPMGQIGIQDKQIMTRFEAEVWDVVPGDPLQLFDTALGRIGILICYDSEFPLLARALKDADILLVPSVTEAISGHTRVKIGARARALENQCITAMASVVGAADWSEAVDFSVGAGGVYGPPDTGFPENGVLAQGGLNTPGWTVAEIDTAAVTRARRDGTVLNRRDWNAQIGRDALAPITTLR